MQNLNEVMENVPRNFFESVFSGEQIEIEFEKYYFWLNILPPISQNKNSFYFAEGYSDIIHFWSEICSTGETRYFCQNTFMKNRLS